MDKIDKDFSCCVCGKDVKKHDNNKTIECFIKMREYFVGKLTESENGKHE